MNVLDKGTIMHKVFELITDDFKNKKEFKSNEEYINSAFKECEFEKDDIFVDIFKKELNKIINSFKEYIKTAKNPEIELKFYLDENLKISNENNYFIKDVIDGIYIDETIEIVDYKSKKLKSKKDYETINKMIELKEVQLPLYFYFAKQKYNKPTTASLISFYNDKYDSWKFAEIQECDEIKFSRG